MPERKSLANRKFRWKKDERQRDGRDAVNVTFIFKVTHVVKPTFCLVTRRKMVIFCHTKGLYTRVARQVAEKNAQLNRAFNLNLITI